MEAGGSLTYPFVRPLSPGVHGKNAWNRNQVAGRTRLRSGEARSSSKGADARRTYEVLQEAHSCARRWASPLIAHAGGQRAA